MKNKQTAGISGKGFYAALSLSVAMVGAACWYAYSEAGKLTSPAAPVPQIKAEYTGPRTTTMPAQTNPVMTAPPRTALNTRPVAPDADAEEAAAILRHTTATTTAETQPPAPAETEAPVEQPVPPVEGAVIQPFSQGELVKSPTTGIWQTHNGTDYYAPFGTEVHCTEDGTVTGIEHDALYGITVTVLHENGTVTRYCGLNEGLNVQAGDIIGRGTVLGAIGDTNDAESTLESHLHFEVQHNDKYIDPESYFCGALSRKTKISAPEQ